MRTDEQSAHGIGRVLTPRKGPTVHIGTYEDVDGIPTWAAPIADHTKITPDIGLSVVIGMTDGELTATVFVGPDAGLTDLGVFGEIIAEVAKSLSAAGAAADVLAKISQSVDPAGKAAGQ